MGILKRENPRDDKNGPTYTKSKKKRKIRKYHEGSE